MAREYGNSRLESQDLGLAASCSSPHSLRKGKDELDFVEVHQAFLEYEELNDGCPRCESCSQTPPSWKKKKNRRIFRREVMITQVLKKKKIIYIK